MNKYLCNRCDDRGYFFNWATSGFSWCRCIANKRAKQNKAIIAFNTEMKKTRYAKEWKEFKDAFKSIKQMKINKCKCMIGLICPVHDRFDDI
jgi:hypothetical protein